MIMHVCVTEYGLVCASICVHAHSYECCVGGQKLHIYV